MRPEDADHLRREMEHLERIAVVNEKRRVAAKIDSFIDAAQEKAAAVDQSGGDSGLYQAVLDTLRELRSFCFKD